MKETKQEYKVCAFCAETIFFEAKKCKHCHEWQADAMVRSYDNSNSKNVTPIVKFIFLNVITFGAYQLFWFYKYWMFFKKENNINISPGVHVFLSAFYVGKLAGYIKKLLIEHNLPCKYSAILIGVIYFFLLFFSQWHYYFFWIFAPIAVLPLVAAMNRYWVNTKKTLKLDKVSWWKYSILLGFIILLNVLIAYFKYN